MNNDTKPPSAEELEDIRTRYPSSFGGRKTVKGRLFEYIDDLQARLDELGNSDTQKTKLYTGEITTLQTENAERQAIGAKAERERIRSWAIRNAQRIQLGKDPASLDGGNWVDFVNLQSLVWELSDGANVDADKLAKVGEVGNPLESTPKNLKPANIKKIKNGTLGQSTIDCNTDGGESFGRENQEGAASSGAAVSKSPSESQGSPPNNPGTSVCPVCYGRKRVLTGQSDPEDCPVCNGTGEKGASNR